MLRWLAVLGAGAAAAVLALAGATGLVLRSDWLLGQIDADPDSLFVTFTEARASLVPGRIRFATLTLRSRDQNVEWEARLEDVTVDVALRSLAARRFRAETVRAAALTFRLRERLAADEATPARAGRYPPIPGYRDPPLRAPPEPRAAPGNPWCVVVDDLRVALVREIWIDAWRWEGKSRLSGGLFLRPGIEAEVLPSELNLESGTLHWGAYAVSRGTAGRVRAALPRFVTQKYPGNEVWKIMSGAALLDGTLDALPFLSRDGGKAPVEGGGSVRVRVSMTNGRGGGRVTATLHDARPLLALLPSGPPAWIAGLLDLHDFEVSAVARIAPGFLAASPVQARAGTFSLDADWRTARGHEWGALLLKKGILSLGLTLGDSASATHLVGAASWFEAEGRPGGLRTDQPRDSTGVARPSR
ncbi:MAG: hypothetical protein IPL89_15125 [Acidobacteria bacterium]|nr:hypothetical protein [Acidobacteriota bacterium]